MKKIVIIMVCFISTQLLNSMDLSTIELDSSNKVASKPVFIRFFQVRPTNIYDPEFETAFRLVYTGNEALLEAAAKGDLKTAKAALDDVAQVNTADKDKWTPLHLAALKGDLPMVTLLLKYHADINAADNRGNTPLNLA